MLALACVGLSKWPSRLLSPGNLSDIDGSIISGRRRAEVLFELAQLLLPRRCLTTPRHNIKTAGSLLDIASASLEFEFCGVTLPSPHLKFALTALGRCTRS